MDARRTNVDHPWNEVDTWLHACDICVHQATNPVAATCGHLFCTSCLDDALLDGQFACPICNAELPEEMVHSFPNGESVASAGPTRARRPIVAEAAASASNNITMIGPVAAAGMRSNTTPISRARMEVVQDLINEEMERTHTKRVDLIRYSSNLKAQRIRGLEQAFETVVRMNVDLLREMEDRDEENRRLRREMEDRDEDNRGLRRRIAELENPIAGASSNALGMNSMRHRRFGRRITPTPLATRALVTVTEEQPIPVRESVEGGSSSMNSQAGA